MNDWQHGTRQPFFANTHISHIVMWWNSAEWVVSVVTHFQLEKFCTKTSSDTQQLLLPKHCVPIAWSFEISGAGRMSGCFHPAFHLLTALSCVIGRLTTNISTDDGMEESAGCTNCQLDVELSWQKEISVPWMNKCRKLLFISYYTSQCWHDAYLQVHEVGSIFFTGPYWHRQS